MTGSPSGGKGPVFRRQGDLVLPSPFAAGPWDAGALHGGSAGGLMTWAMEAIEPDPEMPFARVTCEFLRPVPVAPLRVHARLARPGRRVQLIEAEVHHEDTLVCRATGLRIRAGDADLAPGLLPQLAMPPGPGTGRPPGGIEAWGRGLIRWIDLRVVRGDLVTPGPAAAWLRYGGELVEGSAPTPLQRAVTAADFGNGLSGILDFNTHLYINPDLTVYLHRYPQGDWVGLDSTTWAHPHGIGLAESQLWDLQGPIGRSLQSLVVGKRG
ncbi:MAG: thioesterase family protein [Candidatus Dormibacteria bacterium]